LFVVESPKKSYLSTFYNTSISVFKCSRVQGRL
jgi:hypothetical protein